MRARDPLPDSPPAEWSLPSLAGRLVEVCGTAASATLTLAFGLVLDAQTRGEPVAWLSGAGSCFFPPDADDSGVDLEALVVVRAPDACAAVRAADQLARSGAFGLLVIDLGAALQVPMPLLSRLLGLARKHDSAVVFLTEKAAHLPSLSSLVSLRGQVERSRQADGGFLCELRVLKDKRNAPGWTHLEVCRGPAGLR